MVDPPIARGFIVLVTSDAGMLHLLRRHVVVRVAGGITGAI